MNSDGNNNNQSSRGIDKQFANSRQDGDNISAQCDILITVEAIKPQHNWIGPNTMATANTNIFLVTNSIDEGTNAIVAFSNIGSALDFVKDSHGDLNAEGSALMLEAATGLVPATNKAVKDRNFTGRTLRFTATDATGAKLVAAAQSKLDGALQACILVGVDPSNVAMVANLRDALEVAQESASDSNLAEVVTFEIAILPLHKRKHNKRS
jgi:hypothetical protein